MSDLQVLADLIDDLDRHIAILENADIQVAALCLRMAKMELQMKLHGIIDSEFEAFSTLLHRVVTKQPTDLI